MFFAFSTYFIFKHYCLGSRVLCVYDSTIEFCVFTVFFLSVPVKQNTNQECAHTCDRSPAICNRHGSCRRTSWECCRRYDRSLHCHMCTRPELNAHIQSLIIQQSLNCTCWRGGIYIAIRLNFVVAVLRYRLFLSLTPFMHVSVKISAGVSKTLEVYFRPAGPCVCPVFKETGTLFLLSAC